MVGEHDRLGIKGAREYKNNLHLISHKETFNEYLSQSHRVPTIYYLTLEYYM